MTDTMKQLAELVKGFDVELRQELQSSRSGVFRKENGEMYVRSNVPLGQEYPEEVIGIFADIADLDFFYKIYLENTD